MGVLSGGPHLGPWQCWGLWWSPLVGTACELTGRSSLPRTLKPEGEWGGSDGACTVPGRTEDGGTEVPVGCTVRTGPWEAPHSATDSVLHAGPRCPVVLGVEGAGDPGGHPRGPGDHPPGHWMSFHSTLLGGRPPLTVALQWCGPGFQLAIRTDSRVCPCGPSTIRGVFCLWSCAPGLKLTCTDSMESPCAKQARPMRLPSLGASHPETKGNRAGVLESGRQTGVVRLGPRREGAGWGGQ